MYIGIGLSPCIPTVAKTSGGTSFDGQYFSDDTQANPYYTDDAQLNPYKAKD